MKLETEAERLRFLFYFIGNCVKQTATDAKETLIGIMFRMWERALPAFLLYRKLRKSKKRDKLKDENRTA